MHKWLVAFSFFAAFVSARGTKAEYRAFLLKIESSDGQSQLLKSTLDPDQYRGYFPIAADQKISYIDTWRCPGRTNNLPICKNPKEVDESDGQSSSPERTPAGQ